MVNFSSLNDIVGCTPFPLFGVCFQLIWFEFMEKLMVNKDLQMSSLCVCIFWGVMCIKLLSFLTYVYLIRIDLNGNFCSKVCVFFSKKVK